MTMLGPHNKEPQTIFYGNRSQALFHLATINTASKG